jgi:hypothetical protein
VIVMTGVLRVPRSRGALNGTLLVLLGAWGGLIAFIGPYFHYAYTPDKAWTYTTGRLWLEIVPAAGTILGGLILSTSASRPSAIFGAWLAALSGAWFALGGLFSTLWSIGGTGQPVGDKLHRVVEQIGFFTGLGVVIVFLAAVALGRLTVIGARERLAAEAPAVEQVPEEDTATQPVETRTRAGASPVDETRADGIRDDDTRVDDLRADDTRVDGDTVPETATPPNTQVEETHVAGTRIGDPSL